MTTRRQKRRTGNSALKSSILKLIIVILVCAAIKAAAGDSAPISLYSISNSTLPSLIIQSELGVVSAGGTPTVSLLSSEFPFLSLKQDEELDEPEAPYFIAPEDNSDTEYEPDTPDEDNTVSDQYPITEPVVISNSELSSDGIYLKNGTDYEIDIDGLLNSQLTFSANDGAEVLIIHTHACEAYTPAGEDIYTPSDPYRTLDEDYSVIRVGDELTDILTEHGITVIHDTTLYDYPNYNYAYSNAWTGISAQLEANPNIKVVIDLHRDALEDADGTVYKTIADIGDDPCAQVMLVVGSDYSGLSHDNWQENLKFALKLQATMVEKYPSLARPLNISKYRYNQHATLGSLIVEVGCSGNTLQEALNAVSYFGDCLSDVLDN